MFKNKKHAKIIAITVVGIFILGILGIALTQSVGTYASPSSKIGKVNYDRIRAEHPGMNNVINRMETEIDRAQRDFDERTRNMNDQQKQAYFEQVSERLALLERDLIVPLMDSIDNAIRSEAERRGLEVVFDSRTVYFGGIDITEDVIRRLR